MSKKIRGEAGSLRRESFIREIALEADVTFEQAKYFVDALEHVFEKSIAACVPLDIRGLGHLSYTAVPLRKGFNGKAYGAAKKLNPHVRKEDFYEDFPETVRVNFKLSENLLSIHRQKTKKGNSNAS